MDGFAEFLALDPASSRGQGAALVRDDGSRFAVVRNYRGNQVLEGLAFRSSEMSIIYILNHTIVRSKNDRNTKRIGFFSSRERADAAREHVKTKSGFKDPRGYFTIEEYRIDEDQWTIGFATDGSELT